MCLRVCETDENKHLKRMREAHRVHTVDVSTEKPGELWVSDSPAAVADSSSQSPESLEDDAVYKTHVEKDFITFCSSTPRMCLLVTVQDLWA